MLQSHQEFIDECLREHNKYRKKHSVNPLRHSLNLDKSAQEWAEDLLSQNDLHNSPLSGRGEVGENISSRSSSSMKVTLTGSDVCRQWYKDIKNYDFEKGVGAAGNFTQMIWASTEEVGFGIAHCKGRCIVVAHYRPPGNVKGSYLKNVRQPESSDYTNDGLDQKLDSIKIEEEKNSLNIADIFKQPLTHSRTSSMSSDTEFERDLDETPDLSKPEARNRRQFIRDSLELINSYRLKHDSQKLVHSKELSAMAQKWAEELADKSTLSNSNNSFNGDRVGESVASRWSNQYCEYGAKEVIDHWYSENSKYSYDAEPQNVQGIGNFSQMVWKSTRLIGIGKAYRFKENNKRIIIVCNYFPAGNILKRFRDNVSKPN